MANPDEPDSASSDQTPEDKSERSSDRGSASALGIKGDLAQRGFLVGEFRRSIDDRFRLSIPAELLSAWLPEDEGTATAAGQRGAILAKERPGCLSLWHPSAWSRRLEESVDVVASKLRAGRLGDRLTQVQTLGRLLSTRHREVTLAGRGRLVVPEGFREFLRVDPGSEVIVVGAAVCVEIWAIDAWLVCLEQEIPRFGEILDDLSR